MNLRVASSAVVLTLVLALAAQAGTMLQPAAAVTNMGSFSVSYDPSRVIDQTGLAAGYTSGGTDFDAFAPATNTVLGGSASNTWFSSQNVLTGNFDFSLGGLFNIESFALWTDPQVGGQGVNSFNLLADDNPAFSSPTSLGTYNAANITSNAANFGQVFAFSPTVASHVRMEILSNHGSTFVTGIVEAAFEVVVPEPGTLAMLLLAPVALLRRRSRFI